ARRGAVRAAARQARAEERRPHRDPRGAQGRREGGRDCQLPDRRRKQPAGCPQGLHSRRRHASRSAGDQEMIAALIRWSAKNLVLIFIATILAGGAGIYALRHVPLDAIPDLSDTQVIIYTEYSGQAPQVIEDQVTYPLSTAMLSVPKARVVRGFSYFGVSF